MKKINWIIMILIVLFLGACTKKEDITEIKIIYYETSSFGVISQARVVDMENGVIKNFSNREYRKGGTPMSISEIEEAEFDIYKIDDVTKFEKKFKNSGFFKWEKKYIDNNIMDGSQWSLKVEFKDGSSKSVFGSNLKPLNFNEVISTLN